VSDLCTILNVQAYGDITASVPADAALTLIVAQVSRAMESFVRRQITDAGITDEQHRPVNTDTIVLNERAEAVVAIDVAGTALVAADWELMSGNRMVVRKSGTAVINWENALVKFTYTSGWTTVPADWVMMAVKQSRHEWQQHGLKGSDRFAQLSRDGSGGQNVTWVPPTFLPDVLEFLKRERRIA